MSYSVVLQVQNIWKCDYKLLKAKKRTVNRPPAQNRSRLESVYFPDVVNPFGYYFDT